MVSIYDYDSGEYMPDSRIVYGEYSDVSLAVSDIADADADAPWCTTTSRACASTTRHRVSISAARASRPQKCGCDVKVLHIRNLSVNFAADLATVAAMALLAARRGARPTLFY